MADMKVGLGEIWMRHNSPSGLEQFDRPAQLALPR
jgi:hypothetical protein